MKHLTLDRLPWLALIISGGLLGGALFFEHVLGYSPCQMCYWQRHAHKVIIGLSILALIMNRLNIGDRRFWAALIGLVFMASFALAFWHVGVEFKWWDGPKTCMTGKPQIGGVTGQDLIDSLSAPMKMPGCDNAAWHFLGLSMAAWNALVSLLGALTSAVVIRKPAHV
ncbi:MAG: disulfide bond formation protein B [Alphaproteobacteria bacterium]